MIKNTFLSLIFSSALLTGCHTYHMEIPQGTTLTDKETDQIQKGMTKAEVITLLGKPQLTNAFPQDNRLDYVYTLQKQGKMAQQTRFTLIFNHRGKVVKIIKETFPTDNETNQ